jgi:hypothetical protein
MISLYVRNVIYSRTYDNILKYNTVMIRVIINVAPHYKYTYTIEYTYVKYM